MSKYRITAIVERSGEHAHIPVQPGDVYDAYDRKLITRIEARAILGRRTPRTKK